VKHVRTGSIAASVIVIGLAGCARDAEVSIDAPSIERVTPVEMWTEAPAGCEDARVDALEWTLADGAPELVVLVDHEARAVCVDTFDQVLALLDETDPPEITASFHDAPERAEFTSTATNAGDPEPQPMHQRPGATVALGGTRAGDPEPQPMRGPSLGTSDDLDP
jgi:hypothetical protein